MKKITSFFLGLTIAPLIFLSAIAFADDNYGGTHTPTWTGDMPQNNNKLYINKEDGLVHYSYDIGSLQAKGMNIPLALRYDSGTKVDLAGLGTNWSIDGLPTIVQYQPSSPTTSDPATFTLYLGNGNSYSLLSTKNSDGSLQFATQPDNGNLEGVKIYYCPNFCTVTPKYAPKTTYMYKMVDTYTGLTYYLMYADESPLVYKTADGADYSNRYIQPALITNTSGSYVTADYKQAAGTTNLTQYGKITLTTDTGAVYTLALDFDNQQINIDMPNYRRVTVSYAYLPASPGSTSKGKYPHDSTSRYYPDSIITKITDKDLLANKHYVTSFSYQPYNTSSNPINGVDSIKYDSDKLAYYTHSNHGYTSSNSPLWYNDSYFGQPFINAEASQPAKQSDTASYPNEPAFTWGASILSGVSYPSGKTATIRFLSSTVYDDSKSLNVNGIPQCRDDEQNGEHHCGIFSYHDDYHAGAIFAVPYATNIDYSYTNSSNTTVTLKGEGTLPAFNAVIPTSSSYNHAAPTNLDQMHNYTAFPYVAGTRYANQDAQWQMISRRQDGKDGGAAGYGEADDQYLYKYAISSWDYYVKDSIAETYTAPHLLVENQSWLSTKDVITKTNAYDNLGHSSGNIVPLEQQPKNYDMPSVVTNTVANSHTHAAISLQRVTSKTYTQFGDIRTSTFANGMTLVNYYNYDADYDTSYRHLTATVILPDTTRASDSAQKPSSSKPVYAYFSRFTVDPETNLVTTGEHGYIPCKTDSNGDPLQTCFDLSTIGKFETVAESDLYNDIFSTSPPDKTGWISKQTKTYDSYGRLETSDYYPSPITAPTLAAVSLKKQYFTDYNSLTAEDIDVFKLPTYLTSQNTADNPVWYVLSTVTNKADPNGTWLQDTRTHKTLDIISQYTGKTLATFTGYDQTNQVFLDGKAISFNAFLIPQQMLDINRDHATDFSYTLAKGNNQHTLVQYYCKGLNSPDAVASIDYLTSSSCTPIKKSETALDDLQRKTSLTAYQSADGKDWHELNKVVYSFNDAAGGVIATEDVWYQGQHISQTTPIYDASHNAIGEMTYALPVSSGNESDYSSKVYEMSFQDRVANRNISFKLFPCSGHSSTSSFCFKSLTIEQKESVDSGKKDPANNPIMDAKGDRIISVSTYRYKDENGYMMSNLSTFLDTLKSEGDATNTQNIINGFLQDIGLGNATGNSVQNMGVVTNSAWTLSSQQNYFYDIYNRATSINILSKEPNSNKWKNRVMVTDYDVKNRLIKSGNAINSSAANSNDGSQYYKTSGYSTQVENNGELVNADIISTSYRYNDMDQITSAILYQDTLDTSKSITPENSAFFRAKNYLYDANGKLRQLINCGGANYPDGGCKSNTGGNQTVFSAETVDANKVDTAYDSLGRLVQWKDASQNTHRKSFYDTQQLKSTWIVNNSNLTSSQPICYAYDYAYNWRVASYFATTVSDLSKDADCSYANQSDITNVDASTRSSVTMTEYLYDSSNNHLIEKTFPDGSVISNTYDDNGLLKVKSDIKGFFTKYTYLSQTGLLHTAQTTDPSTNKVIASVSYGYDNENRVNTQTYGDDGEKKYTRSIYEEDSVITYDRTWVSGSNNISNSSQFWNYDGTMAQINRQDFSGETNATQYTYDALSRISANTATSQPDEYDYDGSGNLTNLNISRDALDEISNSGYSYDVASNLTADPKGKYSYNDRNQLVSFTPTSGSDTWTYKYDTQGNLYSRTFNNNILTYYWSGLSLETIKSSGSQGNAGYMHNFFKKTGHFTSDATGAYQDDIKYLVKGLNNNILGTFSDTSLATYSPYGELTASADSLTDADTIFDLSRLPWSYKGGLSLPEMGSDTLFHKRIYDADIRSFTQSDPDQRDFNRSRAFNSDPIAYNDPTGLFGWHALGHKIGHNIKMGYHKTNHGIDIGLEKMQIDPVITPMVAEFLGGIIDTVEAGGANYEKEMILLGHPHFGKACWYKKIINTPIKPVAMRIYDGFKGMVVTNIQAFKTGNWELAVQAGFMDGFFIASIGEGAGLMENAEVAESTETETVAENEERSDQPRSRRGAIDKDAEDIDKAKQEKPVSQRLFESTRDKVLSKLKFWKPHPLTLVGERANEIYTTKGHPDKYQRGQ